MDREKIEKITFITQTHVAKKIIVFGKNFQREILVQRTVRTWRAGHWIDRHIMMIGACQSITYNSGTEQINIMTQRGEEQNYVSLGQRCTHDDGHVQITHIVA